MQRVIDREFGDFGLIVQWSHGSAKTPKPETCVRVSSIQRAQQDG
jgi:hypothetical protein